jgi:hypothetical protein
LIHNLSENLGFELQSHIEEIGLPKIWDLRYSLELEVKKSVLRSKLRYSNSGIKFSVEASKLIASSFQQSQIPCYHTMIYPMIHLVGDQSEEGEYHTDQVGRLKLRTGWTAITEYDYEPLRYIPFGLMINSLSQRLFNKNFPQRFGLSLNANRGSILTWGGGFFHSGNINDSNNISCAVVLRISDQPLNFEPTRSLQLEDVQTNIEFAMGVPNDIAHLLDVMTILLNWTMESYDLEVNENLCLKMKNLLQQNNSLEHPMISFSLSLLAQRIRTKEVFFDDEGKSQRIANILDLLALLSGAENLSSLKNLVNSDLNKKYAIIKLVEDLLADNLARKSRSWSLILQRENSELSPIWTF